MRALIKFATKAQKKAACGDSNLRYSTTKAAAGSGGCNNVTKEPGLWDSAPVNSSGVQMY